MAFDILTERNVVALFTRALTAYTGQEYLSKLTREFQSTQALETYAFASQVPSMREWSGGRQQKKLSEHFVTATNKPFEATLEISRAELRRDNTGMIIMRLNELAARTNSHWHKLIMDELIASTSTLGYDGANFFSATHETRDSGVQSNLMTVDISTLPIPTDQQGSTTAPSSRTIKAVIFQAIQRILSFKDSTGEPFNEDADRFCVLCGTSMLESVSSAITSDFFSGNEDNNLKRAGFNLEFYSTPRLDSVTDAIFIFRESQTPTFIRQSEKGVQVEILGEGSDYTFSNDGWLFGVSADRAVTNYDWANIVRAQLI